MYNDEIKALLYICSFLSIYLSLCECVSASHSLFVSDCARVRKKERFERDEW